MRRFFSLLLLILISSKSIAHSDNKPGPHGGLLRMTGSFHTEVILQKHGMRVMLLDMQLNEPTVTDSSVKAVIQTEAGEWSFICKPKDDYFFCPIEKKFLKNVGTLQILAKRQDMQGAPADYRLPLTDS